jgi:hypothetical protein
MSAGCPECGGELIARREIEGYELRKVERRTEETVCLDLGYPIEKEVATLGDVQVMCRNEKCQWMQWYGPSSLEW